MQLLKRHQKRLSATQVIQTVAVLVMSSSTATESIASGETSHQLKKIAVQEVLQQVITAYGGADKIKQRRDRGLILHATISSTSGMSNAENSYECNLMEKGDKVRVEMTLLGAPMVIAYDGNRSWQQYGDWVAPAPKTTSDQIADELKHGLSALYEVSNPTAIWQLLPKQAVGGRMCHVLELVLEGRSTKFYVDPVTHLILKADYSATDHELGINSLQSLEYKDYRPIAGTQEPFEVIHWIGQRKKNETHIHSVDESTVLNDKLFDMPPESEIARLKDGPMVIPFEYSGNEILITVRLNGKESKFILDTGASQSVVDKAVASNWGSHAMPTFSITAGSRAVPLNYTSVPSLAIGDVTFYDIPVLITDLSQIGEKPTGLIGANILRRFLVTINFEEKTITLADPRKVNVPATAQVVPTKPAFGGSALIVEGRIDNKQAINFLVDTGASFNNLPQSLAKPFLGKSILPVGVIYGIDGQKMNIGSLKLKNFKLSNVAVSSPVFAIAPDNNAARNGLFTSSAMGILGNPIWSQFKTTIDYRNERLILEPRVDQEKFRLLFTLLEKADADYLKSRNTDEAIKAFSILNAKAEKDGQKAIEALTTARLANCYADKYSATKENKYLDAAAKEFEKATKIANQSRQKDVEGQILAQWALMYLNMPKNIADIGAAQALLTKALQKAPMEPSIFAAFGIALLRVGKLTEAEKLLDRTLVLDPANWTALWGKYKLYKEQNKIKELSLVTDQLNHYYSGFPDVVALSNQRPPKQTTP